MKRIKKRCGVWLAVVSLIFALFLGNIGGMYALKADAASDDAFIVQQYDVEMSVRTDRKIEVKEEITIFVNTNEGSMFYRSLPTTGARYENFSATCEGNDGFYFYVADNEEVSGYVDVNCVGGIAYGKVWTYEITYLMEQGSNEIENGMIIDAIGFGWTVPLHNVTVTVNFPQAPIKTELYTDVFGSQTGNQVTEIWSSDKKVWRLHADKLALTHSERYDEIVAGGITLSFEFSEGVLPSYASVRMNTGSMWKVWLGSAVAVGLSILVFVLLRTKRDLITVVNVTAPDDMDPMKMGKWIDGTVNNEDITSMIYYFANKGYLKIDLTDQEDPKLISLVDALPDTAPIYQKTLFDGLFEKATAVEGTLTREICVSKLEGKFYEASQMAMKQVPDTPPMYETKSIFAYVSGAVIGAILAFLIPYILAARLGGGYKYYYGIFLALPLLGNGLLGLLSENYRYKWKKGKRLALLAAELAIAVVFSVIFIFIFARHVMTEYERLVLCIGVFASAFVTSTMLARTEGYLKDLENILGFKEFIVVTEEDKIKVMLEENPHLYYKVLPYAQVLGVTDEWESKFAKLLVQPPYWCTGADMTWFDYYILHRCISRSMTAAMVRAAASVNGNGGGRFVGRSGGGGSFGGFGGGGFGGGGGGIR